MTIVPASIDIQNTSGEGREILSSSSSAYGSMYGGGVTGLLLPSCIKLCPKYYNEKIPDNHNVSLLASCTNQKMNTFDQHKCWRKHQRVATINRYQKEHSLHISAEETKERTQKNRDHDFFCSFCNCFVSCIGPETRAQKYFSKIFNGTIIPMYSHI